MEAVGMEAVEVVGPVVEAVAMEAEADLGQ